VIPAPELWRALAVALLDRIAERVPLATILEGGT